MSKRTGSDRWMTLRQVADHFQTSVTTVRLGRGVFARLRRAPLVGNRYLYLRSDVERLDRDLEKAAVALAAARETPADVVSIDEGRRKSA